MIRQDDFQIILKQKLVDNIH